MTVEDLIKELLQYPMHYKVCDEELNPILTIERDSLNNPLVVKLETEWAMGHTDINGGLI